MHCSNILDLPGPILIGVANFFTLPDLAFTRLVCKRTSILKTHWTKLCLQSWHVGHFAGGLESLLLSSHLLELRISHCPYGRLANFTSGCNLQELILTGVHLLDRKVLFQALTQTAPGLVSLYIQLYGRLFMEPDEPLLPHFPCLANFTLDFRENSPVVASVLLNLARSCPVLSKFALDVECLQAEHLLALVELVRASRLDSLQIDLLDAQDYGQLLQLVQDGSLGRLVLISPEAGGGEKPKQAIADWMRPEQIALFESGINFDLEFEAPQHVRRTNFTKFCHYSADLNDSCCRYLQSERGLDSVSLTHSNWTETLITAALQIPTEDLVLAAGYETSQFNPEESPHKRIKRLHLSFFICGPSALFPNNADLQTIDFSNCGIPSFPANGPRGRMVTVRSCTVKDEPVVDRSFHF